MPSWTRADAEGLCCFRPVLPAAERLACSRAAWSQARTLGGLKNLKKLSTGSSLVTGAPPRPLPLPCGFLRMSCTHANAVSC